MEKSPKPLGSKVLPRLQKKFLLPGTVCLPSHTVIQHISSGNSVALIRMAKALGAKIHAEATPHHFTLTDKAVLKHESLAKMTSNPASLYKLPGDSIEAGALADFVIFDPKKEWTPNNFSSKSSNSPFTGMNPHGRWHSAYM